MTVTSRGTIRALVDSMQRTRAWRAAGSRFVGGRVEVVRAADAPAAAFGDVYGDEPDPDGKRRRVAWLALLGARAIGGTLLAPCDEGLFLSAMRVRWPYRRCGVATALVRAAQEEARRSRATLWLVVEETNAPALALYIGRGLAEVPGPTPFDRVGHVTLRFDP